MYFYVHFNVFFKLIRGHLLVSELYIHQNVRCKDKKNKYKDFNPCRLQCNQIIRSHVEYKEHLSGVRLTFATGLFSVITLKETYLEI